MRTYSQFLEDLDSRRVALAQRKKQQMARIQQQNVQSRSSAAERVADAKSRLASDSDEMNKKEAEWKAKRKAAQDARDEAEAEKERKQAMKDEIRQELEQEREEKRKAQERKRMEKEKNQEKEREEG